MGLGVYLRFGLELMIASDAIHKVVSRQGRSVRELGVPLKG